MEQKQYNKDSLYNKLVLEQPDIYMQKLIWTQTYIQHKTKLKLDHRPNFKTIHLENNMRENLNDLGDIFWI